MVSLEKRCWGIVKKKLLVAGSANMDVCLEMERIPQKGENLIINGQNMNIGGKGANRAVAAARLGASVDFSCRVGDDSYGRQMLEFYEKNNINTRLICLDKSAATGTAYIFLENDGANRIMVNGGANFSYGEQELKKIRENIGDYGAVSLELEIPPEATEKLIGIGKRAGIPVIVDLGPRRENVDLRIFEGAYLISPNESETEGLTGILPDTDEKAEEACSMLYRSGAENVIIKMGGRGSMLYDGKEFYRVKAKGVLPVVDTTGAGDTYMSGLAIKILEGMDIRYAMHYATICASLTVSRKGSIRSLPYLNEVSKLVCTYPNLQCPKSV